MPYRVEILPTAWEDLKQIEDYYKIFEEVCIICSETNVSNMLTVIPESCGLYSYKQTKSGKYIFKLQKTAKKNLNLDVDKQLQIVRKSEFYDFFKLPNDISKKTDLISFTKMYYDAETINHIFKKIIKKSFEKQWNFLKKNHDSIYEIDYQWFYKNQIEPSRIYG